tara:strand:- start:3976 stop:5817 length:1842 start_codon:yes stop_codon:yes gene_type:complete
MKLPTINGNNMQFTKFTKQNKNYLLQKAFLFGAILFKDFKVTTKSFEKGINNLDLELYEMIGSAAPRSKLSETLYTANDSPPSEKIPMHHEMAQNLSPPSYIFFYCNIPSENDGETPIIDSREIVSYVKYKYPKQYIKFKKGIHYTRFMTLEDNPQSALGRGWINTFDVSNTEDLKETLTNKNMEYELFENDVLKVKTPLIPAIRKETRTKQEIFCNSVIAAYLGWNDNLNNGKTAVEYYDNTFIEEEFIENINEFINDNKIEFKWEKGDILMIDNSMVMHSRNNFTPPREIITTIRNYPNHFLPQQNSITLPSWDTLPLTHFGTWKLKNVQKSVEKAIESGYRSIDCACDYGNEEEVGKAISKMLRKKNIKRKDLFVTSKLWNTYHDHVEEACLKSLQDLKLSYLDLYLIHFPISLKHIPIEEKYPPSWQYKDQGMIVERTPMYKVWNQMEKLVKKKMVRNIGICNFPVALIGDLLSYCEILPAVIQIELHAENYQDSLVEFCKMNNIHVSAFSPLGGSSYGNYDLLNDNVISAISQKYNCTNAQILLSFLRQKNISVVVRSDNETHIENNLKHIELTSTEIHQIHMLNRNKRFNNPRDFTKKWNGFQPIFD